MAVALYGAVCAITCLCSLAMRWYASFHGRLMKKEIGEAKMRRDVRLSLSSCFLYLAGMAVGFFFPWLGLFGYAAIPGSYAIGELVRHKGHGQAH